MHTTAEARRSVLHRAERLRLLSDTERDLIRLAGEPGFPRWLEQIKATGGCAHPVYLSGRTTTLDADTGAVLRHYDTATEPGGRLAVRCRNRRESRCEPCSRLHSGDTFHLVRSGLLGGKNVPATVTAHPRLFVTLTAPSFGPVHRVTADGARCRPRRGGGFCEHGRPLGCGQIHAPDDRAVGQPLCADCYDYASHVLWHAHAGELWNRTTRAIRRHLATAAGQPQSKIGDHLRLSFAKVAEYQRRGAVHFHAVIRLDGPDGPASPPPTWASAQLLVAAVRSAADSARVSMPYAPGLGELVFRWGDQLDVHPIRRTFADDSRVTDQAVAAYVAKYVSKSVGEAGDTDYPITSADDIALLPVSAHVRALMGTCWRLGRLDPLEHLRLRAWAHTLGYRGHALTKSRRYSTTYGELRAARAAHRAKDSGPPVDAGPATVTESAWRYVGSGHTSAEADIAAGIAEDLAALQEIRRDLREGRGRE
ncbi:plasmid replication initiator protein [Streptomyces sp. NBC_01210]|uniref:replication initiator n=1 Tax=Streptomyces sp. NBC_01210 TaxID=2903774 RepID=UPI002E140B51|nr:plasmid replication initiator protein [Streptomyces sp. NBC_01210]